jgi:peptidyl-prolyl cis-trans isomerase A (cyclophilin A)
MPELCHVVRATCLLSTLLILLGAASCRRAAVNQPKNGPLAAPEPALALAGLPPHLPVRARLETSEGVIHCALDALRAPRSVALFVGLATGRAPYRDPRSGLTLWQPMYRDLRFFRAVPNVLVQTGCLLGNGTGSPGYRIAVEVSADDARRLATPGVLLLARYHAPPNRVDPNPPPPGQVIGSQFVVGLSDLSHLAGEVSVLGACADLDRVRALTRLVASHEREVQLTRVVIEGVDD